MHLGIVTVCPLGSHEDVTEDACLAKSLARGKRSWLWHTVIAAAAEAPGGPFRPWGGSTASAHPQGVRRVGSTARAHQRVKSHFLMCFHKCRPVAMAEVYRAMSVGF